MVYDPTRLMMPPGLFSQKWRFWYLSIGGLSCICVKISSCMRQNSLHRVKTLKQFLNRNHSANLYYGDFYIFWLNFLWGRPLKCEKYWKSWNYYYYLNCQWFPYSIFILLCLYYFILFSQTLTLQRNPVSFISTSKWFQAFHPFPGLYNWFLLIKFTKNWIIDPFSSQLAT